MLNKLIYKCIHENNWISIFNEVNTLKYQHLVLTSEWCNFSVTSNQSSNIKLQLINLFEPYINIKNNGSNISDEMLKIILFEVTLNEFKSFFQKIGKANFKEDEYKYMNIDISYRACINNVVLYVSSSFDLAIIF